MVEANDDLEAEELTVHGMLRGRVRRVTLVGATAPRFSAGDRAYLVGPYEELLQVLRRDALSPTQLTAPRGGAAVAAGPDEVTDAEALRVPKTLSVLLRRHVRIHGGVRRAGHGGGYADLRAVPGQVLLQRW